MIRRPHRERPRIGTQPDSGSFSVFFHVPFTGLCLFFHVCILPCPVHRTLSVLSCSAQKALTPELCQPAALAFFFVPEPDLFPDFDLCCAVFSSCFPHTFMMIIG